MKKKYIVPLMRVEMVKSERMICTSSFGLYNEPTNNGAWSKDEVEGIEDILSEWK